MKTSDLFLTLIIFTIFIGLYFFNILAVGAQTIKKNWTKYRCNPMVMPFAGVIGPEGVNVSENFTYCVQNMQSKYSEHLMQPLNYNMSAMGSVASTLNDSISSMRSFSGGLRTMITDIIQKTFGVFLNIVIEFQRVTINIKDVFGKLVGIFMSLVYILSGSVMTMESAWSGPPGQAVRALGSMKLCFKPNTLIQLDNGELIQIENVELGKKLKNGSEVLAVMKLHNLDKNGKQIESFYKIPGGENNEPIYVTGSHLLYDNVSGIFKPVCEFAFAELTNTSSDYFSCLITTDHVITIGNKVFHDWEDNNGSKSKDL